MGDGVAGSLLHILTLSWSRLPFPNCSPWIVKEAPRRGSHDYDVWRALAKSHGLWSTPWTFFSHIPFSQPLALEFRFRFLSFRKSFGFIAVSTARVSVLLAGLDPGPASTTRYGQRYICFGALKTNNEQGTLGSLFGDAPRFVSACQALFSRSLARTAGGRRMPRPPKTKKQHDTPRPFSQRQRTTKRPLHCHQTYPPHLIKGKTHLDPVFRLAADRPCWACSCFLCCDGDAARFLSHSAWQRGETWPPPS